MSEEMRQSKEYKRLEEDKIVEEQRKDEE